jgi:hypothetical protein
VANPILVEGLPLREIRGISSKFFPFSVISVIFCSKSLVADLPAHDRILRLTGRAERRDTLN